MIETSSPNLKRLLPWIIYLIFFAVLNETVFNVSTPKIALDFSLTPAGVSWVMTIFLVFFGIGSVIFGKLSDLYSLRSLITIGIVVYNLGSLLGFFLQASYPWVIVARAIQGAGASALPALVFVVVARYYPAEERGKVFGLITSLVSVSIGIGPVLGGFVSQSLHWTYLFLIPLPVLISIPFLNKELPQEETKPGKVDILGAALVAVTVGALVLYLNYSEWPYLAALLASLTALLVRILTAAEPFIEPRLFQNAKFRAGVIVGFLLFSIVIGIFFLIPLMLSKVHNVDTGTIGLLLFPGAISGVFVGPIAGNLADKKGNSFVVALGLIILVLGLLLMSVLLSISPLIIAAGMFLANVGFCLFQTAMFNAVSQTLPEDETGVGMGIFNLVSIISGAVGTALVGKILTGGWFDFSLLPDLLPLKGASYSNILLVFSLVVVVGGVLYLRSYRKTPAQPLAEGE